MYNKIRFFFCNRLLIENDWLDLNRFWRYLCVDIFLVELFEIYFLMDYVFLELNDLFFFCMICFLWVFFFFVVKCWLYFFINWFEDIFKYFDKILWKRFDMMLKFLFLVNKVFYFWLIDLDLLILVEIKE